MPRASLLLPAVLVIASTCFATRQIRLATGDAGYRPGFEAVAHEYERLHPDVSIAIQIVPGDAYATYIRTMVAGGEQTAPDIFNINYTAGYFESGKAISLRPYLFSKNPYTGKMWIDMFYRQYLEMLKVGGDYPSVPYNFIEIGFFYNKDIFDRVGVKPPSTWTELISICQKIKAAGYIPVAMPADFDNVWQGTFGWVVRVLTDSYFFDVLPVVMAHPGDFIFDPAVDGTYKPDPNDPYCDLLVNLQSERMMQAILDGDLRFDGPRMRDIYTHLRKFSGLWQRGFNATNATAAYQLFLTRKAAIILHVSAVTIQLDYDLADMNPSDQFRWGVFQFPTIDDSALPKIKPRGTGGPIPVYGILRKNKEQNDLAADFLMYLTTPKSAATVLQKTLESRQSVAGPFAMKDVPVPASFADKFAPFLGRGREKLQLRGLLDEQQSTWRWGLLTQDYMGSSLDLDTFLEQYQLAMVEAIPRVIRMQEMDMDPRTRDNNTPLIAEIEATLQRLGAKPDAVTSHTVFVKMLAAELKSLARLTSEAVSGFDLVEEDTFPFLMTEDVRAYENANKQARETAVAHKYQYLLVVQLGPKLHYKLHNFRPTTDEVIKGLQGKRYSREKLKQIYKYYE